MTARTGTKAEYAAHIGASAPYVSKLKKQGRLVTFTDDKGRERVDFDATDRNVRETTDLGRSRNGENAKPQRPLHSAAGSASSEMPTGAGRVDAIFRQAQAQERAYNAKIAELEYRKMAGELIQVQAVREQLALDYSKTREVMMQIPSRLCPLLAAEADPSAVHLMLSTEIHQALMQLAGAADAVARIEGAFE